MSLKAKIEAIIYAAEEPATIDQIMEVVADEISAEQSPQHVDNVLPIDGAEREAEPIAEAEQTLVDAKQEAKQQRDRGRRRVREILEQLAAEYESSDHGMEIRQVAGGYRMSTKPEHHDVVRSFAKSLKPPIRLSLQALETLAVIAYKQPVTGPEISEIRGVDSSGVLASLISRKLITTAGRKQVIGRPILYKTTKDFLLRFGLKDLSELPSIEEFEKLTAAAQNDLFPTGGAVADGIGVPERSPEQADTESNYDEKNIETPRASNE
ncbi:MAG TPA: SMC-Scp complex subunit ScpB [Terriglobales bacterium]|nr:SMC-Scp complex subunit ScpB [Terriglobales bacterium]